jgi:hypothetical protein
MWAEGLNAKDIHKEMFVIYGGKCLSQLGRETWQTFLVDDEEVETEVAETTGKNCGFR